MTDRETIIDLLNDVKAKGFWEYGTDRRTGETGGHDMTAEDIADYLLENGVTVQEWISVKDRLPTIYDADEDNCVLAIHKASKKRYYHWRSVADNPFDFTHWMKTPQPPKGE